MDRRSFVKTLSCAALLPASISFGVQREQPQVAITFDDFNWFDSPLLTAKARNKAILQALHDESIRAAIFVCARYVDNDIGQQLLGEWAAAGHIIANHSYSHLYYHRVSFDRFSQDLLHGDAIINRHPTFRRLFRFPYLKEGETAAKRDRMRLFLKEQGYRNGSVTIDASDWYIDDRMRARVSQDPKSDLAAYRQFYLAHVWDRATYYDRLALNVIGRGINHTLLLHHNVLNGLFLANVIKMFKGKGWKVIDPEEAYRDRVFSVEPNILPAGESLVWALAKQSKKYRQGLRYPGEDGDYEKPTMDKLNL